MEITMTNEQVELALITWLSALIKVEGDQIQVMRITRHQGGRVSADMLVDDDASAFKWFPGGSVVGRIVYSGSALANGFNPTGGIGGAQTFASDLIVTGSVTRGTVT